MPELTRTEVVDAIQKLLWAVRRHPTAKLQAWLEKKRTGWQIGMPPGPADEALTQLRCDINRTLDWLKLVARMYVQDAEGSYLSVSDVFRSMTRQPLDVFISAVSEAVKPKSSFTSSKPKRRQA